MPPRTAPCTSRGAAHNRPHGTLPCPHGTRDASLRAPDASHTAHHARGTPTHALPHRARSVLTRAPATPLTAAAAQGRTRHAPRTPLQTQLLWHPAVNALPRHGCSFMLRAPTCHAAHTCPQHSPRHAERPPATPPIHRTRQPTDAASCCEHLPATHTRCRARCRQRTRQVVSCCERPYATPPCFFFMPAAAHTTHHALGIPPRTPLPPVDAASCCEHLLATPLTPAGTSHPRHVRSPRHAHIAPSQPHGARAPHMPRRVHRARRIPRSMMFHQLAPQYTRPAARGTSRCMPVLATSNAGPCCPCTCRLQAWRAFGRGSEAACIHR
ncbi:hypothetical protein GGX14DRAFT_580769 [Mycena pura]|uniref:Uncharacterized protein n=1 Tax=Mycena pura TaxID=153505 RepID=A0AAD6Y2Z5_9AGAR|nr:hypothetical protein GGX14DRAFT_580769 [Mycena pura]